MLVDHESTKRRKHDDGLINEKRKIAEKILEIEKLFQENRRKYNKLIE